jgi:hypothetical protein
LLFQGKFRDILFSGKEAPSHLGAFSFVSIAPASNPSNNLESPRIF